jgi:hypothetical protein
VVEPYVGALRGHAERIGQGLYDEAPARGTLTEGKNSEGKTIWLCIQDGKVIANCELDDEGYGGAPDQPTGP